MKLLAGLGFAAFLFSCGYDDTATHPDAAWVLRPNSHAQCFKIFARGDHRRVVIFGPRGEQDTAAVLHIGTGGIPGGARDIQFDRVSRLAVLSTTHLSYISLLGRAETVVGASYLDRVRDAAIRERIDAGHVQELATADGVDHERLLVCDAQAVLDYPFGSPSRSTSAEGLPFIPVTEYLEEHPLGRAEWIRFFGVLLNAEERADSLYAAIEQRYAAMRGLSTQHARPTVLFGSSWQGQWFVPPGNSYMAHLIEDAGGYYLFADRKAEGNITLDLETLVAEGSKADIWGMIADVDGTPSEEVFTGGDQRLATFKSVQLGQLFLGNTATSDLFGQALIEPDVVLRELQEILALNGVFDHPTGYRPKYFVRLDPQLRQVRIEGVPVNKGY